MDDLDRKLIGLLRENARMPAASLAKALKVARGTVQNRLAKLERDGIIAGYTMRCRKGPISAMYAAPSLPRGLT